MARQYRKRGKAADINEDTEAQRQDARDADTNVVKLPPPTDETRAQQLRDVTAEFNRLKAEGQRINAERKAQLERIDALGLDRNEFRALVKLLEVDDEKRTKKGRTRREFLRAHNLPEQVDMFEPKEPEVGAIPGLERAFVAPEATAAEAPGVGPAVAAAIADGWLTEEEIAANREAEATEQLSEDDVDDMLGELDGDELDGNVADDLPEDETADDDELFERAGVATVTDDDEEAIVAGLVGGAVGAIGVIAVAVLVGMWMLGDDVEDVVSNPPPFKP